MTTYWNEVIKINLEKAELVYDEIENQKEILCTVSTSDIQEDNCVIKDARCVFDVENKKDRYDFLVQTNDGQKWIPCWGINVS